METAHSGGGPTLAAPFDAQKTSRLSQRVYEDDVDGRGQMSLAAMVRFLDRGRVDAIAGVDNSGTFASWLNEFYVTVYRIDGHRLAPAVLGDEVHVLTSLRRISSHRAGCDQRIVGSNGEVLFDAVVELLFLNQSRELVPVPEAYPDGQGTTAPADLRRRKPVEFGPDSHFPYRSTYRVYYEDTDAQGITYHATYARFCRRAWQELTAIAWPEVPAMQWLARHPLTASRLDIRYARATFLNDWLEVRTGLRQLQPDCLALDHRIVSRDSGAIVADAIIDLQYRDAAGCPQPFPESIVAPYLKLLPPGDDVMIGPRRR
jgi:acyl-CoA thioester hydrolase